MPCLMHVPLHAAAAWRLRRHRHSANAGLCLVALASLAPPFVSSAYEVFVRHRILIAQAQRKAHNQHPQTQIKAPRLAVKGTAALPCLPYTNITMQHQQLSSRGPGPPGCSFWPSHSGSSISRGHRPWPCASFSNANAHRFREINPDNFRLPREEQLVWPSADMGEPNPHVATIVDASENFKPEQFWDPHSPPGSLQPRNPYSQKWRIKQVNLPQPFSLPGSDYWHVEMLNDYKKELPSIRVTDNHVQLRLGVLGQVADPPLTPFFFYKGIERVTYSWTDRTWQALAVAAYAGGCALRRRSGAQRSRAGACPGGGAPTRAL